MSGVIIHLFPNRAPTPQPEIDAYWSARVSEVVDAPCRSPACRVDECAERCAKWADLADIGRAWAAELRDRA